ncbi:MAG: type II secretion system F family protein [Kiritimatiellae bacterium]|nr:type II secretion system F family protein [Kiritimatiellia bacterium]
MASTASTAAIAFWALCAAGFAWYAAEVAKDVTYVTLADGRRQERSLPLVFKLLLPFVGNLDRIVSRPLFAKQIETADGMLVAAGFEGLLSGREFVALKLMNPVVLGALWCVLIIVLGAVMPDSPFTAGRVPLCLLGVALFYLQPMMWLRSALKRRHLAIMKALPFVLDILTLSVEAGMDFISALQRNCASRRLDPLNEELLRMTKEIQVGSSRKEALKNMADRCRQGDLRSVAYALIQADELGVSIGSILRIQSEQLRSRRFDRAEKLAAEAPTKMLGPLFICIFPAVFIILLGPVLSQALKGML